LNSSIQFKYHPVSLEKIARGPFPGHMDLVSWSKI